MVQHTFLERVRESLDGLHPAERRLATFLLDFPGEIAAYTGQELSELANVSAPTVSRFIKRLGYANYEEARRHVRTARKTGAALYMVGARAGGADAQLLAHIEQAQANLAQTFSAITANDIENLAAEVLAARRVWIIGFRTSHAFSTYFHTQIYQVCANVTVAPAAGQTMAEQIAAVGPEDCVILIGLARRPQSFGAILAAFKARGAKIAYISDEREDHRAELAWHLRCATLAPGPLYSHVAVMLLLQILATRVIQLSGHEGRRRLGMIEDLHHGLNEL